MQKIERSRILTLKDFNNSRLHPKDILSGREFRRQKRKNKI